MRLVSLVLISAFLSGCTAGNLAAEKRLIAAAKLIGHARSDYEISQTIGQACLRTGFTQPTFTGGSILTYAFQLTCITPLLVSSEVFYLVSCEYEISSSYKFIRGTYRVLTNIGENTMKINTGWARLACPASK